MKEEFIKNLICWLFGHQLPDGTIRKLPDVDEMAVTINVEETLVWCIRCDSWKKLKRFKL